MTPPVAPALACNSSRRSSSAFSRGSNSITAPHAIAERVKPAARKKSSAPIAPLKFGTRDLTDDQDPDNLGHNRIREEFAAGLIGIQQHNILALQKPEDNREYHRHRAQERRR